MKSKWVLILGLVQLFVATGALPVGYLMITKPDGSAVGMTTDILTGSPFKDFLIPGIFLFTVNGLFNLAGSILAFFRYRYIYLTGFALGLALIIWIAVQVFSIGLTHFLQPAFFIIGTIEIVLSLIIFRTRKNIAIN